MANDPAQDLLDLLSNGINYSNIENTTNDLSLELIYDNYPRDSINTDTIYIYHISGNRDNTLSFSRKRYNDTQRIGIQIYARERYDSGNSGGLYALADEVKRVLEVNQDWKIADATANYDHIYIDRDIDVSDKRSNFYKYVIEVELVCIAVATRTS